MNGQYEVEYRVLASNLALLIATIERRIGTDPCPFAHDVRHEIARLTDADGAARVAIETAQAHLSPERKDGQ